MQERLDNKGISTLKTQYADDPLYQAIRVKGPTLEATLPSFGLCPEECFIEAMEIITLIHDKDKDISQKDIIDIWTDRHNQYKRLDRTVSEEEIRKVVSIVFAYVILAIDSSHDPFYRHTLTREILQVLMSPQCHFPGQIDTLDTIFSTADETHFPDQWFDIHDTPLIDPSSSTDTTKKSGKDIQFLFIKDGNKSVEDTQVKNQEKERFMRYLTSHNMSSRQLTCQKDDTLNKAITCFLIHWHNKGLTAQPPSGAGLYRFLTQDCNLKSTFTPKSYRNKIIPPVKNHNYDQYTMQEVDRYFNN